MNQNDGSTPQSEDPLDAATPPVIVDAGMDVDASEIDAPDAMVEGPVEARPVPPGECSTPESMGLYQAGFCDDQHLQAGIERYVPQFPLWTDGAVKDRYIFLPSGSFIDSTNTDRWNFPKGTKLWKTFTTDGLRIETRVLTKNSDDAGWTNWTTEVYLWASDGRSATLWDANAIAMGVTNALGTNHDVPSQADCANCHGKFTVKNPAAGMPDQPATINGDGVNGFGAIQLNWDPPADATRPKPLTLRALMFRGQIRNGPTGALNVFYTDSVIAGDPLAIKALGYMHANCGHCHGGETPRGGFSLLALTATRKIADEPASKQACVCLKGWYDHKVDNDPTAASYLFRIKPGYARESGIVGRMSSHKPGTFPMERIVADQMPKLGTEFVDEDGLGYVEDWINSLDPNACILPDVCPAPPPPMMTMTAAAGSAGGAGGMGGSMGPTP